LVGRGGEEVGRIIDDNRLHPLLADVERLQQPRCPPIVGPPAHDDDGRVGVGADEGQRGAADQAGDPLHARHIYQAQTIAQQR
jgi:hypothetical protein